jgi:hypothetical protein
MAKTERERWMDPKTWLWVLGINAWGALLAVPAWHLKLWGKGLLWGPLLLPLLVLVLSILRSHQVGLLFLFPAALLLPAAIVPRLTGVNVYITSTFLITVLSLSAYLLGAAAATRDGGITPRAVEVRALVGKEIPARWRRRLRIIMVFAALTVVVPTMLLSLSNGTSGGALIAEEPLQPMIVNAAAFLLGLGIVLGYFMAPLVSFLRNETPPFLGVARHPLRSFGFWVALLSGGAAVYFLFSGEA